MTLADIAKWHRDQQRSFEHMESFARFGERMGNEDAGWEAGAHRKQAELHGAMALTLENFAGEVRNG